MFRQILLYNFVKLAIEHAEALFFFFYLASTYVALYDDATVLLLWCSHGHVITYSVVNSVRLRLLSPSRLRNGVLFHVGM